MNDYNRVLGVNADNELPPIVADVFARSSGFYFAVANMAGSAINNAVVSVAPGAVQSFASTEFNHVTTNTTFSSIATTGTAKAVISGLELEVVGTGRPVEITFHAHQVYCSTTAGRGVGVYLISKKDADPAFSAIPIRRRGTQQSSSLDRGPSLDVSWDVETVLDEIYRFRIGVATDGVGTSNLLAKEGTTIYPMTFKARNH